MRSRFWALFRGLLAVASMSMLASAGCGSDKEGGAVGSALGDSCNVAADCASGSCSQHQFCTRLCQSSADCVVDGLELDCGIDRTGQSACVPACGTLSVYACVDGKPVSCESFPPGSHCTSCACPSGQICDDASETCVAPRKVGEPCDTDSDCSTGNCSEFAKVCRVPAGQACTATNCDRCLTTPAGYAFCSKPCGTDRDCAGELCMGDRFGNYFCEPRCHDGREAACPGRCVAIPVNNEYIVRHCDCPDCTILPSQRELGQLCDDNDQCRSGDCQRVLHCDALDCIGRDGTCSKPCASSADCPDSMACADIPCAEGERTTCGKKCLNRCSASKPCVAGTCLEMPVTGGAPVQLCQVKFENGAECQEDSDCRSLVCTAGACASSAKAPNGALCALPQDCASGNCAGGKCRGMSYLGDTCQTPDDCAVGTCCSGVCASSC